MPSSNLLSLGKSKIVIDCGLGVSRGLCDQNIDLRSLETIFITHLHSDHYLELGPLLLTAWTAGLSNTVHVYGPSGLDHYWTHFSEAMKFDIDIRIEDEGRPDIRDLIVIHPIADGQSFKTREAVVSVLKNNHPPLEETFALRFASDSGSIVFSGDTSYHPPLIEFAANADVLVHEAMLEKGVNALCRRVGNGDQRLKSHLLNSHTFAEKAGEIAQKANVKKLLINHLIPSDDPSIIEKDWIEAVRQNWSGELYLAQDGLRLEF